MRIFVILFFSLISVNCFAGNDQGNGGNVYSAEFAGIAQKITIYLEKIDYRSIDLARLRVAVESTHVECVETSLQLLGFPKDALNYPKAKKIVFSCARWSILPDDQKLSLVLHEYLSLLNYENSNYVISSMIINNFKFDILESIFPSKKSPTLGDSGSTKVCFFTEHWFSQTAIEFADPTDGSNSKTIKSFKNFAEAANYFEELKLNGDCNDNVQRARICYSSASMLGNPTIMVKKILGELNDRVAGTFLDKNERDARLLQLEKIGACRLLL